MCDALCVLCFAVGMFCVRVGHVVVTRQTDWLSLFFCLNRMVRYRLSTHWFPQVTGWIFPTQRPFSAWVWGWVSSVEFTCGNNITRWYMMIVASIQIVSLTLNQISWCSDGILSQSQMSLLLRNLCGTWPKDPHQQSSKPEKWKVHDISFSKHQKLLKNSSWAQSYDDLKKVRFFLNT